MIFKLFPASLISESLIFLSTDRLKACLVKSKFPEDNWLLIFSMIVFIPTIFDLILRGNIFIQYGHQLSGK